MKPSSLTTILCHLLLSFLVAFCVFLRAGGCPNPEDITPCMCYDGGNGLDILQCRNIKNGDELRTFFQNSIGYQYWQVEILSSSFTYIPHEIFVNRTVERMILENVVMIKLFDEPPPPLPSLLIFEIKNCRFSSLLTYDGFQSFTRLQNLRIIKTSERTIDDCFNQYISKDLKTLFFDETDTGRIKPGALSKFSGLKGITCTNNKLTELRRDMFPIPYRGLWLNFNGNKITSLAQDLFTQMPSLQSVFLIDNLITTLPEFEFDDFYGILGLFGVELEGNPIQCDCRLKWYLQRKDKIVLAGNCSSPASLSGKYLGDLTPSDFHC